MTVRIEPTQGIGRSLSSTRALWPWKYASGDWIVPGGQRTYEGETVPSVRDPDLAGPLDQFDATWSDTSHTVTIGTGEMTLMGAYVGSDDTALTDSGGDVIHDVQLDASTNNQEVYIGYDHTETDEDALIIDRTGYTESDFSSSDQPREHIWTFDTDGSGVTNADGSPRPLGKRIDIPNVRYDAERNGRPDLAEDSDALGGRSLTQLLRDTRNPGFGQTKLQDGQAAKKRIDIGPGAAVLLQQNHVTPANDSPTGLQTAVHAGDGTVLYEDESTITRGTIDNPVEGPWDRAFLVFRLENNTGGPISASAGWSIFIE